MTDNEFSLAMIGEGQAWVGSGENQTRLRYVVADAFDRLARERGRAGRPDRAGLLRYISGQIRHGQCPSKKSVHKAAREVQEVKRRLVDGVPMSRYEKALRDEAVARAKFVDARNGLKAAYARASALGAVDPGMDEQVRMALALNVPKAEMH